MAVTTSGHSCPSSMKMSVLPGISSWVVKAESRRRISRALLGRWKMALASGASRRFSSMKLPYLALPKRRIAWVLPVYLAPLMRSAFVSEAKHPLSSYLSFV